jgi:hypothetical protein
MAIEAELENGGRWDHGRLARWWRHAETVARDWSGLRLGALRRQPLTVGGIAAGIGIAVGAAAVLKTRTSAEAGVAEEIVARALCREAPDTPTHLGPLWTGYRKDARRVLKALRDAGLLTEGV